MHKERGCEFCTSKEDWPLGWEFLARVLSVDHQQIRAWFVLLAEGLLAQSEGVLVVYCIILSTVSQVNFVNFKCDFWCLTLDQLPMFLSTSALTNDHKLGDLEQRKFLCHCSIGWNSGPGIAGSSAPSLTGMKPRCWLAGLLPGGAREGPCPGSSGGWWNPSPYR